MLPRARGARQAFVYAGLAALPAFVVLTVPKFAADFARFGPQEPLLLGGLALGGSLLWVAGSELTSEAPVNRPAIAGSLFGGTFFWLLGVYQKEISLSAIPLIAAAAYLGRARLARWPDLSTARRFALLALGAVIVVPLTHVAIQVARFTIHGDLVYGAEVDGGEGIVSGLELLHEWAPEAMPEPVRQLLVATVALVVVASAVQRSIDVLAVGALGSGVLAIVFAAQSGVVASRYYIPIVALFVVAASVALSRLPDLVAAAGVLAIFFASMPPTETRAEVRRWSSEEQQHAKIVQLVAELEHSGCMVAAGSLDPETSLALPVLEALEPEGEHECAPNAAYLVIPSSNNETVVLLEACVPGRLEPILVGRLVSVHECVELGSRAKELLDAHRIAGVERATRIPD
jgi:hypothetical protein